MGNSLLFLKKKTTKKKKQKKKKKSSLVQKQTLDRTCSSSNKKFPNKKDIESHKRQHHNVTKLACD